MKTWSKVSLMVALAIVLPGGCKDDGTTPGPVPTSGTATINNARNQVSGFSFVRASVIVAPNPVGLLPDFSVFVQTNAEGMIVGVFFARPDSLQPAFRLLRQSSTIDSAQLYFQSLGEIPDTTYVDMALPVSACQIWAIRTRQNTFGKILVRQTAAYADSSHPGLPTLFGEATFSWAYQPNGTRRF